MSVPTRRNNSERFTIRDHRIRAYRWAVCGVLVALIWENVDSISGVPNRQTWNIARIAYHKRTSLVLSSRFGESHGHATRIGHAGQLSGVVVVDFEACASGPMPTGKPTPSGRQKSFARPCVQHPLASPVHSRTQRILRIIIIHWPHFALVDDHVVHYLGVLDDRENFRTQRFWSEGNSIGMQI